MKAAAITVVTTMEATAMLLTETMAQTKGNSSTVTIAKFQDIQFRNATRYVDIHQGTGYIEGTEWQQL